MVWCGGVGPPAEGPMEGVGPPAEGPMGGGAAEGPGGGGEKKIPYFSENTILLSDLQYFSQTYNTSLRLRILLSDLLDFFQTY